MTLGPAFPPFWGMAVPEIDYRAQARKCLAEAQHVSDAHSKAVLLAMAQIWLKLARDKDAATARLGRMSERNLRP